MSINGITRNFVNWGCCKEKGKGNIQFKQGWNDRRFLIKNACDFCFVYHRQ